MLSLQRHPICIQAKREEQILEPDGSQVITQHNNLSSNLQT
jgi:hypothetical protein